MCIYDWLTCFFAAYFISYVLNSFPNVENVCLLLVNYVVYLDVNNVNGDIIVTYVV